MFSKLVQAKCILVLFCFLFSRIVITCPDEFTEICIKLKGVLEFEFCHLARNVLSFYFIFNFSYSSFSFILVFGITAIQTYSSLSLSFVH